MIGTDEVDWDEIFRALASERRRNVLQSLFGGNGEMDVDELATQLDGTASTDGGTDETVIAYLYHSALPTLSKANLIDWEPTEQSVSLNALAYRLPVGTVTPQLVPAENKASKGRADD